MELSQDSLKQEHVRLQEEPVTSTYQDSMLPNLHPLPPYTVLQGSLHQRALLRAASMYTYDLPSTSMPVYFPQI